MPDDALRLTVAADVSDLKNKMVEAAGSVESASARMASALAAQGLSAKEIAQGLESVGLSAKELAPAAEAAAGGMNNFRSAMGQARVEMGALEGSTGMMASGFARIAAQSESLAPIISAAFPVVAIFAFADIIGTVGEKLVNLYDNVVLNKAEFAALDAIEAQIAKTQETLARSTETAYVGYLQLVDPVEAARQKLRDISNEKFEFKVDDKQLKALPDSLEILGMHYWDLVKHFSEFPASELQERLGELATEINVVQTNLSRPIPEGPLNRDELNKQLELLKQLQGAMTQFQDDIANKQREASTELSSTEDDQNKKAQELVTKQTEAADKILEWSARVAEAKQRMQDESASEAQEETTFWEQAWLKVIKDRQDALQQSNQATVPPPTMAPLPSLGPAEGAQDNIAQLTAGMNNLPKLVKPVTDQVEKAWEAAFKGINRSFEQNFDAVLRGTETTGLAFRKMGSDILMSTINTVAMAGLKWAEHFLVVNVLEKSSVATSIATMASGEAVKRATLATSNTLEITGDAAKGGAAAFASVLEALPFPANVAAAPGVAASQMGAIEGFAAAGSFEHGGIVPINAHAGEMILPKDLSEGVQNAVRGGTLGGKQSGGGETHNYHFGAGAISVHANDAEGFAKDLQKMIRRGNFRFR